METDSRNTVLFIGMDRAITGRETPAADVVAAALELLERASTEGRIDGYTIVRLTPHGGDLNEFILVWGSDDQLATLRRDELADVSLRGQLNHANFGIIDGVTGPRALALRERTMQLVREQVGVAM